MFFRRALVGLLKVPGGAEVLPKLTGENQDVLRGHQRLLDQYGMRNLADSELFLSKNTDGPLNPLSKVYSREEARELFGNFSEVTTAVRFLNLRLYPAGDKLASTTAARKLERNFGWHLYLRAVK
jgi:hypothetical protein